MSEALLPAQGPVHRRVVRRYPKRADWQDDPHAYECYSCEQRGNPPAGTRQCRGCISRDDRPHWTPHPEYEEAAKRAILTASLKTPNAELTGRAEGEGPR